MSSAEGPLVCANCRQSCWRLPSTGAGASASAREEGTAEAEPTRDQNGAESRIADAIARLEERLRADLRAMQSRNEQQEQLLIRVLANLPQSNADVGPVNESSITAYIDSDAPR